MRIFLPLFVLILFVSCDRDVKSIQLEAEKIDLSLENSFRGISVFDNDVWISGTSATIVHYDAQMDTWNVHQIEDAGNADFRDVEAIDENTALAVSAGFPALIYKTIDAGKNWNLVYENQDSAVFLNAMEFWNKDEGLIFGDPMQGVITILKTSDAGESWNRIGQRRIPEANAMEGGFAASGTCLFVHGIDKAWIGVGGKEAKVYSSKDAGESWIAYNSGMFEGDAMRGVYSLAFKDELHGIAVGGEWRNEAPPQSRAYTQDGGKTWLLGQGVDQYRSGCAYAFDNIYIATGLTGTDISYDGGENWEFLADLKLHGLEFSKTKGLAYAMGSKGQIYRLKITAN